MSDYANAAQALRTATGVVITVYLPESVDVDDAETMLRDATVGFCDAVGRAEAICLSVDGPSGEAVARRVADATGAQCIASEANRGKLMAARHGAAHLLEDESFEYIALADQDGDHFANELPNFVRAARHVEAVTTGRKVMVLGRRISRHRPMGFLRGELEELADRVLLDAFLYDAAACGEPLRLDFATTIEEFPDFHSGFKLFSRDTAEAVLLGPLNRAGCSEACMSRHAVESVLTVEAIKAGAWLAVVNRSTLDEQPLSTFGMLDRRQLVADKIIWPCRRLGVPAAFVEQWVRNHAPRLLLNTLAPEGPEEIAAIYRLVVDALDGDTDPRPLVRPEFI